MPPSFLRQQFRKVVDKTAGIQIFLKKFFKTVQNTLL
jgi:hypothetical protein